jgi:small conductance mechanosensitive channel
MDGNLSDFLNSIVPEELAGADADVIIIAIIMIILGGILIVAVWVGALIVSLKINKTVFRKMEKKKGSSITLQFLQKVISLVCVLVFIVIPLGGKRFAQSLLGSTAVLAAVIGLAAGDVIKDMFAGLEISIYKPFDVGSRIMLEDGTAGIVEKLTLRHTVLKLIDTTRLVVPNSRVFKALAQNGIEIPYNYVNVVMREQDGGKKTAGTEVPAVDTAAAPAAPPFTF